MSYHSIRAGLIFGTASGIVTTLGLIIGLYAGVSSRLAIIGGIIAIAIADSFSDATGMHLAEESRNVSNRQIWEATIATFLAKFVFAATFIVPVLIFPLGLSVIVDVIWGLLVLVFLSLYIAKEGGRKPLYIIIEHLIIAVIVIVLTYYTGGLISRFFA